MKQKLKRVSSVRYAIGLMGITIPNQAFIAFLMFYYVETLNLAVGLAAIGRLIFAIWDAFNNVIFGYMSDNTRTKWGRRRPWVVCALPIYILLFVLVFSVPEMFLQGNRLFWYFTIIIFLYEAACTVLLCNYGALFPELFKKTKERATTSTLKQVFGIVGMIIGIALTPIVYSNLGFTWMAVIYGTTGGLILLYSVLGCKEDPNVQKEEKLKLLKSFSITFKNKTFLLYSLAYTFIQFVFSLLMAGIPFWGKYTLKLADAQVSYMLAAVFVVAIPMAFIWSHLIKKWGASKAWLTGVAILAITLIPVIFAHDIVTGIIAGGVLGLGYCGVLISGEVVTSEIIDRDYKKTGVRREAIYLSVYGFIIRISGVFQSLAFALIGILYGYVNKDNPGSNPGEAFRFFMTVIPLVALAIAFAVGIIFKRSVKKDKKLVERYEEEVINV